MPRPLVAAIVATGLSTAFAAELRFIPATPENTSLPDGSPVEEGSSHWKWLPDEGNGGVWELADDLDRSASSLVVWIDGLKPKTGYEVFAYFWADKPGLSSGADFQPVQLGCSVADLQTFDGIAARGKEGGNSWMTRPGSVIGERLGYQASIRFEMPEGFRTTTESAMLVRARLGFSWADNRGKLPVFVAAYPYRNLPGRVWIDGVGVREHEAGEAGKGRRREGTRLHRAVRTADWITLRRELALGAEVNALDEDGVTSLFHACASGDREMVSHLLEAGAAPDVPGQKLSALSAAAMVPDLEIVEELLENGASVPLSRTLVLKRSGTGPNYASAPQIEHPAAAAIGAGSLPVLKRLLEEAPELDLEAISNPYIVADAVSLGYWELAEFLIDRGCGLTTMNDRNFPTMPGAVPLIRAVSMGGEEALPVVAAMERRGFPPVLFYKEDPWPGYAGFDGGRLFPWDGLTAAAWSGQLEMVRRFLPGAAPAGPVYQHRLMSLALHSGNEEIIALVKGRFPDVRLPRWKLESGQRADGTVSDKALRLLLPRTSAPPARLASEPGRRVLAVVSSPDSAGPGDALAALASGRDGWEVVDREMVEQTLTENRIAAPWLDGRHDLGALGDRLAADVLIVTSQLRGRSLGLYRFEVVEVRSGLVVHREFFNTKELEPDQDFAGLLDRSERVLAGVEAEQRRQAVTVLSFSGLGDLANSRALIDELDAAVRRGIDATPGMISMDRSQTDRLIEEKSLGGDDSLWSAAHLLEGVVRPTDAGRIEVALRLESLTGEGKATHDVVVSGEAMMVADLALQAWNDLLVKLDATPDPRVGLEADPKDTRREAERLLREAEWLSNVMDVEPEGLIQKVEAAAALGASPEQVVPFQLELLADLAWPDRAIAPHADYLPISVHLADRFAAALPELRRLLHHAAYLFDRHGEDLLARRVRDRSLKGSLADDPFWKVIEKLSAVRAALASFDRLFGANVQRDVELFGRELDEFTAHYFKVAKPIVVKAHPPAYNHYKLDVLDKSVLLRNPALASGLVGMMHAGAPLPDAAATFEKALCRSGSGGYGEFGWLAPEKLLARKFLESLPQSDSPLVAVRTAEAGCVLARPADRSQALRGLMKARATALGRNEAKDLDIEFGTKLIKRHIPLLLFRSSMGILGTREPRHGGALIACVFHQPESAPDFLTRNAMYLHAIRSVAHVPAGSPRIRSVPPTRERTLDNYATIADSLVSAGAINDLHHLMEGAALFELLTGFELCRELGSKYSNLLDKSVADESSRNAVTPRLRVDLRGADGLPGIAWQPMVDSSNPEVLWILHYPYDKGLVNPGSLFRTENEPIDFREIESWPRHLEPWLVAVDCQKAELIRPVDLSSVPIPAGAKGSRTKGSVYLTQEFGQTKEEILVNVVRVDPSQEKDPLVAVRIRKRDGRVTALPAGFTISSHSYWRSGKVNPVTSIDGSFYFLGLQSSRFASSGRRGGCVIWRLDADGELAPLNVPGRKPELTPFDAFDRAPAAIVAQGNELFVYHKPEHCGYFDPENGTWRMLEFGDRKEAESHQSRIYQRLYQQIVMPIHVLRRADGKPPLNISYDSRVPGHLVIEGRGIKERVHVPVTLDLPQDYLDSAKFVVQQQDTGERSVLPFDGLVDDFFPVPLNQTAKHLVVALKYGRGLGYYSGGWSAKFLPFLWFVPKEELLDAVDKLTEP
ncbi:ankyrin repeat domain-containing protein [Haloferula sp. A504]|uniref:ankyrin repeat domain-containing protein n=1 Tax=Haloferula sp. A504 TaxID=3373601 RepID=UPI0031C1BBB6|nr:ankyrin repeat domain-containing protein [Verrucomicrobiaceae bacterium E54]